ncbi:MAG: hypothetical protein LBG52_06940 [Candidatus Peribacteria bacterium]|nr:hypothetical protein [Candidatus Peribacteria bacterium]
MNIKDYYDNTEADVVKIKEEVFELMEGRNCNGIAPDTIVGILLRNECLRYEDPECGIIQMTNELQGDVRTNYSYNT